MYVRHPPFEGVIGAVHSISGLELTQNEVGGEGRRHWPALTESSLKGRFTRKIKVVKWTKVISMAFSNSLSSSNPSCLITVALALLLTFACIHRQNRWMVSTKFSPASTCHSDASFECANRAVVSIHEVACLLLPTRKDTDGEVLPTPPSKGADGAPPPVFLR